MSDSQAIQWLLSMKDSLSEPASSAEKKLKSLEQQMHKLRAAADETTDKALSKKIGSKLTGMTVQKLELTAMATADAHTASWVSNLDHGLHLVETIAGAALKVGETIADWTKETIGSAGKRESEFISFKQMLGDGEKAKALMEDIARVSDKTALSEAQATTIGKKMLAAGGEFSADKIPTYLKALGDAAGATGASEESIDKAVSAMIRVNATGKLTEKTILAMGAAGIPVQGIYARLAEQLGVTEKQARALVKSKAVNANEGLYAAVAAVTAGRSGGVLGSAGEKAVEESSEKLIGKIREKWERNFANIWDTKGFGKWEGFLRNLNTALDGTTESGKRLKESIGSAFDKLLGGSLARSRGPTVCAARATWSTSSRTGSNSSAWRLAAWRRARSAR